MRFTRAPISQRSECCGFVLLRLYKECSTWLHISPIVERALHMFYLAGLHCLDCRLFVSSLLRAQGRGCRSTSPPANGQRHISQLCQPFAWVSRQQSLTLSSPLKSSTLRRIFKFFFLDFTESFYSFVTLDFSDPARCIWTHVDVECLRGQTDLSL